MPAKHPDCKACPFLDRPETCWGFEGVCAILNAPHGEPVKVAAYRGLVWDKTTNPADDPPPEAPAPAPPPATVSPEDLERIALGRRMWQCGYRRLIAGECPDCAGTCSRPDRPRPARVERAECWECLKSGLDRIRLSPGAPAG